MNKYYNIYGLLGFIKFVCNIIRTRFFYPQAKIIRFPFDIRGKKFISIGDHFSCGIGCRFEAYPVNKKTFTIIIGNNVQINDYVHITGINNVQIGDNVLIASKVYISDSSHGSYSGDIFDSHPYSIPKERPLKYKDVIIEDNVWIGEFVSILPGVIIGKGSIIGTMSVVTKNIPPYSIAVGSPAKSIKKFNFNTNRWEKINSK